MHVSKVINFLIRILNSIFKEGKNILNSCSLEELGVTQGLFKSQDSVF